MIEAGCDPRTHQSRRTVSRFGEPSEATAAIAALVSSAARGESGPGHPSIEMENGGLQHDAEDDGNRDGRLGDNDFAGINRIRDCVSNRIDRRPLAAANARQQSMLGDQHKAKQGRVVVV